MACGWVEGARAGLGTGRSPDVEPLSGVGQAEVIQSAGLVAVSVVFTAVGESCYVWITHTCLD